MKSMHSYQVVDDHGIFGSYEWRADAVSACRMLRDNGTNPKLLSVQTTEEDWTLTYTNEGVFASRADYADVEKIIKECEMDGLPYELIYVVRYGFERVNGEITK